MATHFVNGVKLKIVPSRRDEFYGRDDGAAIAIGIASNSYRSIYQLKRETNEKIFAIGNRILFDVKTRRLYNSRLYAILLLYKTVITNPYYIRN